MLNTLNILISDNSEINLKVFLLNSVRNIQFFCNPKVNIQIRKRFYNIWINFLNLQSE